MFDNLFSTLGVAGTAGVVGGGLVVVLGALLIEFALTMPRIGDAPRPNGSRRA